MNQKILVMASVLVLAMLPMAQADIEIIQGPNALAQSPGATATGDKFIVSGGPPGTYGALMGVNAIALVPNGVEGYAYANFIGISDTYTKSIDLRPGDNHGDTVRFDMGYTGSVSANVEKRAQPGTALAFANIGSGVIDAALPPVGADCADAMAGASGMASILVLPNNAVGNAGASGNAQFNIEKVGDAVWGPSGLTSDEVLRAYGNTQGEIIIAGPGQLVNGAPAAQNQVLGIAALGTATLATDSALPVPGEGASISASGMGTLTAAASTGPDSRITASVAGSADGGAWDGSTPIGTTEIVNVNEQVRTETTGATMSVADAYRRGDFAASLSVLGDGAFHSNSPIYVPVEFKDTLRKLYNDIPEPYDNVAKALEGEFGKKVIKPNETLEQLMEGTQAEETLDITGMHVAMLPLEQYKPEIVFYDGTINDTTGNLTEVDPIVAADIALTAATTTRTQMGTLNSPILTAEAYIDNANTIAVARQSDRSVIASQSDLNVASGAHLRSHPDTVGSTGFAIQAAGQAWPLIGSPTTYGDLSIYGTITAGPPADGDRWDDAGSYIRFQEGLMQSNMGTKFYRTTNGPLDTINWIEGGDLNPRINGQDYMSLFEDSVAGAPQNTAKVDPLIYFETPGGRNTIWLSGTVHGGL